MPNPSMPDSGAGGLTAPSIVPNMNIGQPSGPQTTSVPGQSLPQGMFGATLPSPPTPSAGPFNFNDFSDYNIADEMAKFHPETGATDRLNAAISSMPKSADYKPRLMDRIGGALTAIAGGMAPGKGMSFYHMNPQSVEEGVNVMNTPFTKRFTDWANQMKPLETAANLERYTNVNNRQIMFQTISDTLKQQAEQHKVENDQAKAQIADRRAQAYQLKANGWGFDFSHGPTVIAHRPDGTLVDTGWKTKDMDTLDQMFLKHDFKMQEIDEGNKGRQAAGRNADVDKGWQIVERDDPNNPGKRESFRANAITGETAPLLYQSKPTRVIKPGTARPDQLSEADKVTQQTKSMMEGAQMMLPHINELRQQATELQKRGLFGPAMSRIRDLAGKLGTTGMSVESLDPDEVNKRLTNFGDALTKDPYLSTDALVGQFATTLGLMTSGMGRVHGGARGGGSIQMVNYLKSLLSSDSTIDMFGGRLNAVESFLKTYAAGPKSQTTTKLDEALDAILGPKKQ